MARFAPRSRRPAAARPVRGHNATPTAVARNPGRPVTAEDEQQTEASAPATPRTPVVPFQIGRVLPVGTRKINLMVYGPYGHGKTTFAASALDVPSMRDVLFIDAESGDMSLTSRRDLDVIRISKWSQIDKIHKYLILHCQWRDEGNVEKLLEYEKQLKSEIIPLEEQTVLPGWPADLSRTWFTEQRLRTGKSMDEPYLYRTVIIDSISEVHKYLVYKYTGVDIGATGLNEEIERMEEWQPAQELFRLFIRSFRVLPMNSIFVSAEAIEPAERNKRRNPLAGQSLPKLAGQMAGDIAGFIDVVGYLIRDVGKDGEIQRYLYLGAGYEGWISKHRFENLPDLEYIEGIPPSQGPTLAQLIDLARKDAEADATRNTSPVTSRSTVPTAGNAARTGPTNGRRAATPPSRSGSRR